MVLRNYAYTGALVQGKTSRIRVGGSETRRTKKHQQFITENHHKGIVTHEEFELAQLVITDQKQKGFARDAGFSLKGKIRCGNCGLKMMYNYGTVPVVYSIEKCIAVRPCDKDNINAVKWGTIRNGKWAVLPKSCKGFSEPLFELMDWNDECKYRFRGQYSKEDNEQILLFDLEEPEVIKQEIIQRDLPDADMTEAEENTVDTSENKTKKIVRTLFPKQWQNHFGCSSEDVVLLHRVKYCGNWDVLRPAKIVEGMGLISENLLEKLNNEAHSMIEKMGCAV